MTFIVYRNGTGPVEQRIKAAALDFCRSRHRLPASIVVHKSELDVAREAVKSLELSRIPVEGCGGCLVPEVWLEVGE